MATRNRREEIINILMTLSNPFTHDARVYNEAQALIKAGHNVTVLAWDRENKHKLVDENDEINIIRCHNTSFMNAIPYDIFKLRFWWNIGYKKALELNRKKSFDIVHCHNLDTLPIGIKLKKKLGIKLIYDSHEIWGYMIQKDVPGFVVKFFLNKEKKLVPQVDHIITVAEPHVKHFQGIGYEKTTIVSNCKEIFNKKYVPTKNEIFTLLYVGSLNKTRFLVESAEICGNIEKITFKIAGFGAIEKELKEKSENAPLKNVEFLGKMPMDKVLSETSKADAVLCMLNPENYNNQVGPPNKLFEAMATGRPVIATEGTYSGDLAKKTNMGMVIKFDKESLKNAIIKLRDDKKIREEYGKNALKAAIDEYNWTNQENKLKKVYDKLV